MITVQRQTGLCSTRNDLVTFEPGTTRKEALDIITNRHFPGESHAVLLFDLQPNQL